MGVGGEVVGPGISTGLTLAQLNLLYLPATGTYTWAGNGPTLYTPYSLGTAAGVAGLQILPTGETFAVNAPKAGTSPGLLVGADSTQGGLQVVYTGLANALNIVNQPSSGSFTLTVGANTTAAITAGANAATITAAFAAATPAAITGCTVINTTAPGGAAVVQIQTAGQGPVTANGATITGQTTNQLFNNKALWVQDQNGLKIFWAGSRVSTASGWYSALTTYADNFGAVGWYGETNPGSAGYTFGAPATNATGSGHGYSFMHKYGTALYDMGSTIQLWGNGLTVYGLIAPQVQAATSTPSPSQYVWAFTPPTGGTYTLTLNGSTTANIDTTTTVYTLTPFGDYTLNITGGSVSGGPTATIHYNDSAASIATKLNGLTGASGITVTGTGPYTVTLTTSFGTLTSSAGAAFVSATSAVNVIQNALTALGAGFASVNVNGVGLVATGTPYQIQYNQTLGTTFTLNLGTATGGTLTETDFTSGSLAGGTFYYAASGLNNTATETTLGPITAGVTPTSGQAVQAVVTASFGMGSPKLWRATTAVGPTTTVLTAGQTTCTVSGGGNFPGAINGLYLQGTNILPGTYVVSGQGTATLTLNQAPVATTVTESVLFIGPFSLVQFVSSAAPNAFNISGTQYIGYGFTDYGFGTQTGTARLTNVAATPVQFFGWLGEPATNAAFQIGDYYQNINFSVTRGGQVVATGVRTTPFAVSVSSNAGTVPTTTSEAVFTNSSDAAMTITMGVANPTAQDGQTTTVRIYDAASTSRGITWVNTESGGVIAPPQSVGSTTSPLTVRLQYNGQTSKWRFLSSTGGYQVGQQAAYNQVTASYNSGSMTANTWTALTTSPSITLPNDGNTYRVELFACQASAGAAAGNFAIGIGTATNAILGTMQVPGGSGVLFGPVKVEAHNITGSGQTIVTFARATNASITVTVAAAALNSGQQSPSFLAAYRVV